MLIRPVPVREFVTTVEQALERLPLLDPGGVKRVGDAAPPPTGRAARRPPPEFRAASWRCWVEPTPSATVRQHRDVSFEAEVRGDTVVDLLILCRVGTMRPGRPGFEDALLRATRETRGQASWELRDDELFTRVSLPAKASVERIVEAVAEAMTLSLSETAEQMRGSYGAPDEG